MPTKLPPVPHKSPLIGFNGFLTQVWSDWFQKVFIRTGATEAYTNDELAEDNFVTFARMQDIATDRLIGRDTAGTGDPEQISVGGGLEFTGAAGIQRSALSGDVTASAGSNTTTLTDGVVSFAKLLSTDWSNSKAASGYQKLASGVYLQWGVTTSLGSGTSTSISFPIAFPTGCLQVLTGIRDNSAVATTTTGQWGTGNYSTTAFSLYNRTSGALTFNWFAIGY
jgi:hypothetical protein